MVQERVVTRVVLANGSVINVRNDELVRFLAANSGAAVQVKPGEEAVEVVAEAAPEAETKVSTPRGPSSARASA